MNSKTSYDKLRAKWYARLKREGFEDLEDDRGRLIEYSTRYASKHPLAFASQQRYFELAGQLLHIHSFDSAEQRSIWILHCQGKSNASIARKVERSKHYVFTVIEELAKLIKVE